MNDIYWLQKALIMQHNRSLSSSKLAWFFFFSLQKLPSQFSWVGGRKQDERMNECMYCTYDNVINVITKRIRVPKRASLINYHFDLLTVFTKWMESKRTCLWTLFFIKEYDKIHWFDSSKYDLLKNLPWYKFPSWDKKIVSIISSTLANTFRHYLF